MRIAFMSCTRARLCRKGPTSNCSRKRYGIGCSGGSRLATVRRGERPAQSAKHGALSAMARRSALWAARAAARRETVMRNELLVDLADCTELRQTLLARPPAIVHG